MSHLKEVKETLEGQSEMVVFTKSRVTLLVDVRLCSVLSHSKRQTVGIWLVLRHE